eukprot:m.78275 g.78275  ORF g.78275 m.78275 type:complete len:125 (-) comp20741_c0_seq1:2713-3087(-)
MKQKPSKQTEKHAGCRLNENPSKIVKTAIKFLYFSDSTLHSQEAKKQLLLAALYASPPVFVPSSTLPHFREEVTNNVSSGLHHNEVAPFGLLPQIFELVEKCRFSKLSGFCQANAVYADDEPSH